MPVSGNDPRFSTCCCHVQTCTMVIAVLSGLSSFLELIGGIRSMVTIGGVFPVIHIVGSVVMLIAVSLLIYGVVEEKPWALIPHIVLQAISIVVLVIGGIACIVLGAMISTDEVDEKIKEDVKTVKTICIVAGVLFLLAAVPLQIYFTIVIARCFDYLKAKVSPERSLEDGVGIVVRVS